MDSLRQHIQTTGLVRAVLCGAGDGRTAIKPESGGWHRTGGVGGRVGRIHLWGTCAHSALQPARPAAGRQRTARQPELASGPTSMASRAGRLCAVSAALSHNPSCAVSAPAEDNSQSSAASRTWPCCTAGLARMLGKPQWEPTAPRRAQLESEQDVQQAQLAGKQNAPKQDPTISHKAQCPALAGTTQPAATQKWAAKLFKRTIVGAHRLQPLLQQQKGAATRRRPPYQSGGKTRAEAAPARGRQGRHGMGKHGTCSELDAVIHMPLHQLKSVALQSTRRPACQAKSNRGATAGMRG